VGEARRQFVVTPKFEDTKSADFRYVSASGVFGGLDPTDGRIIFFLDRLEPETTNEPTPGSQKIKKVNRELQVEVHMSPAAFKTTAAWMVNHIKTYESLFGEIETDLKSQRSKGTPAGVVG
jgi:hypothetical protein